MAIAPQILLSAASVRCILLARWGIARAGETDGMAWWRSDALSEAGQFALGKITPRAPGRAGIRAAVEAAKLRHTGMLAGLPGCHLFDFGSATELALEADPRLVRQLWVESEGALRARFSEMAKLRGFLIDVAGIGEARVMRTSRLKAAEGRVAVPGYSEADLFDEKTLADISADLAAAYLLSGPGCLIVPYVHRGR